MANFISPRTAVVMNFLFIAIYVTIFFSIENPWLVFALFILTAILIRSGVLIWMGLWTKRNTKEEVENKSNIVAPVMNFIFGIICSSALLGILWTIGYFWIAAGPVIIFIVSFLEVFIGYKSLFPVSFIKELQESIDALHLIISPIEGDVVQVAPEVSDACILWLRSGFNGRYHIWERIRDQWKIPADDLPWRNPKDAVIPVNTGSLRYIYIFSNPNEAKGMTTVPALKSAISTALDRLAELGCRKPSFIHIPLHSEEKDQEAAEALIETLREWNQQTPAIINEVYLVDRKGAFASYI